MSEKIYAWLFRFYPRRFREEYGTCAMQLFRDRLRAERGVFQRLRLWLDVLADLAISVPREHWRQDSAGADVAGYRLSEEAVTAMTKRGAVAPAVSLGVFVVLGFTAAWLGSSERVLLFAAYFPLAILAMTRFRRIGVWKERCRRYRLIVETDFLLEKRYGGDDLTLLRSEIVKINEDQYGLTAISLHGDRPATIVIPAGLVGYQRVREQLVQWRTPLSQRRSFWLRDPRIVHSCIWSLLPAMLLVRSLPWFLVVGVVYYGLVLLDLVMDVCRPPRNSGLAPCRPGLNLPPTAYMWRRLLRWQGQPLVLIAITLPVVRAILGTL